MDAPMTMDDVRQMLGRQPLVKPAASEPAPEYRAALAEIGRLTAEVNRLQDVIDQMTADAADAMANKTPTKARK